MASKNAKKSSKKSAAKKKAKPMKKPPAQMMQDLQDVLVKHGWAGSMIVKPATMAVAAAASPCPPGKTPQEISYQLPDGTWVSKIICV